MIVDEELFFARRLGFGLRQGETIGSDARTWAVRQISNIPPLDFYGADGTRIRDHFPDFAEPIVDVSTATKIWGEYANKERRLQKKSKEMASGEWFKMMEREVWLPQNQYPLWRDCLIRSLTAVNGPSPVFERFWSFWINHFSVKTDGFTRMLYGPYTRAVRAKMTGTFGDMLRDAVLNPAMLFYLDNWLSAGPHSPAGKTGREFINENLARELLELHTVSPAAGYTQKDVVETAYALSGWGFWGAEEQQRIPDKNPPFGTYFNKWWHEPGARKVLGKTYPPGGRNGADQIPALLKDLAAHPETARFISGKLIRHFVADDPPADSVAKVVEAWNDSAGDLPTIHTAVIDEVLKKAPDNQKFLNPETWLYQSHRTTGVEIPEAVIWNQVGQPWISAVMWELGQPDGEAPQPNGWSALDSDWISSVFLERRVRYAYRLARNVRRPDETVEFLKDFASRLAGPESDLVSAMKSSSDQSQTVALLLSSPQFMRI